MVAFGPDTDAPVVELRDVTRRFGTRVALDRVQLSVPRGGVFGLVGPNGAGKTTLIRHVLGLLRAQAGSVRVFGTDPVADPAGVLARIGHLSEENDLPGWMRVSELVRYSRALLRMWFGQLPTWELALLVPVALVGLVGLTWLQLAAGMCLSLTGRTAVVNGVALLYAAVATAIIGLGVWTDFEPDSLDIVLTILWCLGCALGLLKLAALVWVRKRFGSQPGALMPGLAVVWLVVAGCSIAAIEAGWPGTRVSAHLIALYVVLALPLTRLMALPAALAWNRHR
jgi:energy-coupling factor transporter ATP-binding protein EcfA2